MFQTKEIDSKYIDETLINGINNLFETLSQNHIKLFTDLINQKLLINLCVEMDNVNFKKLKESLIYEQNFGVMYSEINEIILKMNELLKRSGVPFKSLLQQDFDNLNVNQLIKKDKNEAKKFVYLLIITLFNCAEKDKFIDKIALFDDFAQQEFLKIVEKYMSIDDNTRESIQQIKSQRNTISNNYEAEYVNRILAKIEQIEKEKENIDKERINLLTKKNEMEADLEKANHTIEELNHQNKILMDKNVILNKEKEENKKAIINLKFNVKHLEEITKDNKSSAEFKALLDDKSQQIKQLNQQINENENNFLNQKKEFLEKIEILQEMNSSFKEIKVQNDKYKDMLKDYEAIKEKIPLYDNINKENSKMKGTYMQLKEDKESLELKVKQLEIKLQNNELKKENIPRESNLNIPRESNLNIDEDYGNILQLKEDTIKLQEETINMHEERIAALNNDIIELKQSLENEINKKNEEVESIKKDSNETKDRYEKEFELMASSVYNLGLNYWSMKIDYTQKLNEKPNWLVKERQKYLNGDF